MITDREANFLYFSEKIKKRKTFFSRLSDCLDKNEIEYGFLGYTKDIWVRDFMPIQVNPDRFVQFVYDPDYLQARKYSHLKTNPSLVTENLGLLTITSDLKVDGGNIIKCASCVILTEKVLEENHALSKRKIIKELENVFEAKVILVPQDPNDFTGHADGILRFYDNETILVNQCKHAELYQKRINKILKDEGIKTLPIPYNPYHNCTSFSARGIYMNFLEMNGVLILPIFEMKEDELAVRIFKELYPSTNILTLRSNDIARDGGVLNCISWTISKRCI